jgi:hypothetical protein
MIFVFAPMHKDQSKLSRALKGTPAEERLRYAHVDMRLRITGGFS